MHPSSGLQLLFALLLLLNRSSSSVHNDATESDPIQPVPVQETQEEPVEEDSNQARSGGRRPAEAARNGPDQSQVGCRELRSTKYISDGQCTSVNPIKELVCAGECLPIHLLPNWIGGGSYTGRHWSRRDAQEWRCVIDRTRTQRIRLQCQDGSSRTYKITVVTSCKCKRYSRQQNDSGHKDTSVHGGKQRKTQKKAGTPEDRAEMQSDN
ncbi:sclerostin domain-containing protein 1b [Sebastes umbrosus]|uniref:sclerostin domain-containing protein 1b n=1 Tax=Sebastes umbrosus TaxID=72105 RepID=UPI0018A03D17|nr:sclerostin domain-containing protein 1b [Sebastes umbrosus]